MSRASKDSVKRANGIFDRDTVIEYLNRVAVTEDRDYPNKGAYSTLSPKTFDILLL